MPCAVLPFAVLDSAVGQADEDLVARSQAGDAAALDMLLRRYRRLATAKARGYFVVGAEPDDVEQEGMIGLYQAVRNFRPDREAQFGTFAELCVTRQVQSAVKAANRSKHRPMSGYVPLTGEGGVEAIQPVADPAEAICDHDDVAARQALMLGVLSGLEATVLGLYLEGHSYQEIGEVVGRRAKVIDNAVQRIRRKVGPRLGPDVAEPLA